MTDTEKDTRPTITRDDLGVMCAWVIVVNRVPVDHARLFAIDAVGDFGTRACIVCVPCFEQYRHSLPLTITSAIQHLRDTDRRHHLAIDETRLRVLP